MYKKLRACSEMTMELKYFKIKNCLKVFKVAEFESKAQNLNFKIHGGFNKISDRLNEIS